MLKIKREAYKQIIRSAREALPNEACGYLAGTSDTITHCFPMTNIDASPEHYSFDPGEQFEVLRKTRDLGLEIIANYHSHPQTPSRPSEEDIRLAFDPNIAYGIVSLASGDEHFNLFRIKENKVYPEGYYII
jgi:proteasome lid subunit RPN8/RPN11